MSASSRGIITESKVVVVVETDRSRVIVQVITSKNVTIVKSRSLSSGRESLEVGIISKSSRIPTGVLTKILREIKKVISQKTCSIDISQTVFTLLIAIFSLSFSITPSVTATASLATKLVLITLLFSMIESLFQS